MATIEQALEWHKASQLEQAESAYRRILDEDPGHADASNLLGMLLMQSGENEEAERHFELACDRFPNNLSYLLNYASALNRNRKIEQSNSIYLRALSLGPEKAEANAHYGLFLAQLGRFQEAEPFLRKSVETHDHDPAMWVNYGNVLRKLGQLDGAVAAFEQSVTLEQDNAIAWNCLGEAWQAKNQKEEAIKAFEKALWARPDYGLAEENLALAYQSVGRISDARELLEKALERAPRRATTMASLASVIRDQGEPDSALALFRKALELEPNNANVVSKYLYTLNFTPSLDRDEVEKEHLLINNCFEVEAKAPRKRNPESGRIKIAFLSGDFCSHSVAFFLLPLFENLDRERFELHCFSNTESHDSVTQRFKELADGWRDTNGQSHQDIVAIIDKQEIDILIDLSGHTAGGRCDILAASTKTINLNWLGYPNRSGLDSMDARIVDGITDPKELDTSEVGESLLRLDVCFLCYSPGTDVPEPSEPPVLRNGYVTYGSFNNAAKLNDLTIQVWASILNEVPNSRLLLKSWQFEDTKLMNQARKRFAAFGIEEGRIRFSPRLKNYSDHMAAYSRIDIALDPFPYNGTTTTCEALWMGVPVVCMEGDRHAARVGASLLTHSGLSHLLGQSIDDYIGVATALAQDKDLLVSLRESLRPKIATSALCEREGFAKAFGKLVEQALDLETLDEDEPQTEETLSRAIVLQKEGKASEALSLYIDILETQPDHPEANHFAGFALYSLGQYDRSAELLAKASELKPESAEILTHLGCSLQKAGRSQEAIDAHGKAAEIDPENGVILNNYGNALLEFGNAAEAREIYKRSLDVDPASARTWSNFGVSLKESGNFIEALEAGEKSVELDTDFAGGFLNLGASYVAAGECDKGIAAFRKAIDLNEKNSWAWSNLIYAMQYADQVTSGELSEACSAFGNSFAPVSDKPIPSYDGKQLRVGIVSSDFREHAVARFILPLLKNKPSDVVSITLYHDCAISDHYTEELKTLADAWRSIFSKPDSEVADTVREDRIDFLLDLSGHSSRNRLSLFALKPAFAQATWLGFPGSTGLEAMDFRIGDEIALTSEEAELYVEKPLYLKNGYHCIEFADAPDVSSSPVSSGMPFTFGSFNNLSKVGEATLSAWAEILRRAPNARLLLKSYQLIDKRFRERFRTRITIAGIPLDRVTLLEPESEYSDHLDAYRHVDLCLDPFPYNGTTTTCEALYMGVPTLAFKGERCSSRVGASLLNQIGLDAFVGDSVKDYIETAVYWAKQPGELAPLRSRLRDKFISSSLGDAKRFADDFFAQLRESYSTLANDEAELAKPQKAAKEAPSDQSGNSWIECIQFEDMQVGDGSLLYSIDEYNLPDSFAGNRILDASCVDGFWAVEALKRGASQVTAVPAEGCFEVSADGNLRPSRSKNFETCRESLGVSEDRMRLVPIQVYNLDPKEQGGFDWVFLNANANTLRHFVFALDAIRSVCNEKFLLSMKICEDDGISDERTPAVIIEKGPIWLPTTDGLRSLLESASFEVVSLKTIKREDSNPLAIVHARPV